MTVTREESKAKLAKAAAAAQRHSATQSYTIVDRLEERAAQYGSKTFVSSETGAVSFQAINALANRVAHFAIETGLRLGDVVGLLMANRPEYVATWAGLAKVGVRTALLNTNVRGPILRHAIEASGASRLVVGAECGDAITEEMAGMEIWVLADSDTSDRQIGVSGWVDLDAALAGQPAHDPDPAVRRGLVAGDDLLYIFTSGTTGLPKAARISHLRFLCSGDVVATNGDYGPEDVIYCALPLYHGAAGMVVVSSALAAGATIVLRRRFSASRFWEDVRACNATVFQYIGEMCRYLVNQPPAETDREHSVRVISGAGLRPDIWEVFQDRFGIPRIIEGWGSTEGNTSMTNLDGRVGACGRIPFKEEHNGRLVRYDIESDTHPRDEHGFFIECEAGEVGEFIGRVVEGAEAGLARFEGYTSAADTEAKIVRDVFEPGDAWFRSGDLLRRDEDDYYYFVDRVGDTFRWKSENVATQEVAEALAGFAGVEIANVYGVMVPGQEGRAGMAAIVLRDPQEFDGRSFYAFVDERLPRYAAPVFVRLVQEADVTTTFKIRKIDLQREGYDPSQVSDPMFVRDEGERTYVALSDASLRRLGIAAFEAESAR